MDLAKHIFDTATAMNRAAARALQAKDRKPERSVLDGFPDDVRYLIDAAAIAWINGGGDAANLEWWAAELIDRIRELEAEGKTP